MNLFDIINGQGVKMASVLATLATAQRNFTDSLSEQAIQDLPAFAQALLSAIELAENEMRTTERILSVVRDIAQDGSSAISKAVDLAGQLPPAP